MRKNGLRAAALTLFLCVIPLCLSACFPDDEPEGVQKPRDLTYRSDIVILPDYSAIMIGGERYVPGYDSYGTLPSDATINGALIVGENAEKKQDSSDFDIVYTSQLCPDCVWLMTNRDIENSEMLIISGHLEMYEKESKEGNEI